MGCGCKPGPMRFHVLPVIRSGRDLGELGADQIQILEGFGGLGMTMVEDDLMLEGAGLMDTYEALQMEQFGSLWGDIKRKIKHALRSFSTQILRAACNISEPLLVSKCNELESPEAREECIRAARSGLNVFCKEAEDRQAVEEAETGFTRTGADGVLLLSPTTSRTAREAVVAGGNARSEGSGSALPIILGLGGLAAVGWFFTRGR